MREFLEDLGADLKSNAFQMHASFKAASWYHVTYHPDFLRLGGREDDGHTFLSFPWVAAKYLTPIKDEKVRKRPACAES